MTIAINVKGYVNGDDWGVTDVGPSLLTYEEIVAMATAEGYPRTNTFAELNSDKEGYYNLLNDGNHLEDMATQDFGTTKAIIGISANDPNPKYSSYIHHICYLSNPSYAQQYQGWNDFMESNMPPI